MYFSKIYKTSIIDGPGVRVSLYVSGCRNNCPGCHNPESHNFCFGRKYTKEIEQQIIDLMDRPYISGFSIVGGEPMEPENQRALVSLVQQMKKRHPEKSIWCFTGYEFKDLLKGGKKYTNITSQFLNCIDVLIAGRFELDKRDISDANRWRGSTNQRIIDVKKSLKKHKLIYLKDIPNNN